MGKEERLFLDQLKCSVSPSLLCIIRVIKTNQLTYLLSFHTLAAPTMMTRSDQICPALVHPPTTPCVPAVGSVLTRKTHRKRTGSTLVLAPSYLCLYSLNT